MWGRMASVYCSLLYWQSQVQIFYNGLSNHLKSKLSLIVRHLLWPNWTASPFSTPLFFSLLGWEMVLLFYLLSGGLSQSFTYETPLLYASVFNIFSRKLLWSLPLDVFCHILSCCSQIIKFPVNRADVLHSNLIISNKGDICFMKMMVTLSSISLGDK